MGAGMNAIRLATGFVVGFVSEVFRIVAWALLVVLSAYALGMPPLKTLAFETLNALDRLEGHPHHYTRTPTTVLLVGEDRPINAEIYLMERRFAGSFPTPCSVRDGSYVWRGYDDDDDGHW
jgi:hypothetical protein